MLLLSFFFSLQKYEYFQVHANNWDKQYENVMNVTNKRAKNKFFIYACRYPLKRNLDNHRLSAIRETYNLWGTRKWRSVSGTTPHRYDSLQRNFLLR